MSAGKLVAVMAIVCCALAAQATGAMAAPGDLDGSFGRGGVVETPQSLVQGHLRETVVGMAIGPKDEVLVLGAAAQTCPASHCPVDLEITRYGRNGARDRSFGQGGSVVLTVQPSLGTVRAPGSSIGVGQDGRIVVAATNGSAISVVRLTPGGQLDPSFGGGIVFTDLGGVASLASLAVQADGRVVLAGVRETPQEGAVPVIARLLSSGALDPGFGQGGLAPLYFGAGNIPGGLALLGRDGVAAGLFSCCYSNRPIVSKLSGEGRLNHEFAGRGWRLVGRLEPASIDTVMAARRGRLVVVGEYRNQRFAMRFLANGTTDERFGEKGIVWASARSGKSAGAAIDRSGRLLIAVDDSGGAGFRLGRLRPNGSLDLTFAGGVAAGFGVLGEGVGRSVTVGLQSTGRVVVLGENGFCSRTCSPSRMLLGRYIGGSSHARCAGLRATIVGTRKNDVLEGTERRDVIQAFDRNDRVLGLGGNDVICGGRGEDVLDGGPGRDRLIGGAGKDKQAQ